VHIGTIIPADSAPDAFASIVVTRSATGAISDAHLIVDSASRSVKGWQ
jgi:hypothetical protein